MPDSAVIVTKNHKWEDQAMWIFFTPIYPTARHQPYWCGLQYSPPPGTNHGVSLHVPCANAYIHVKSSCALDTTVTPYSHSKECDFIGMRIVSLPWRKRDLKEAHTRVYVRRIRVRARTRLQADGRFWRS